MLKIIINNHSHNIRWFFIWWNVYLLPQGFFIYFSFNIRWFFSGFIEKLEGKISSFLTEIAFPHPFVWTNDISTALGKKMLTSYPSRNFFPLGSGNINSSQKKDVVMPHCYYSQWKYIELSIKCSLFISKINELCFLWNLRHQITS